MTLMAVVFAITANAQYNVGTSSTTTDYFGNQTTTHRNQYGQTTGTSTSSTDYFGNTTTTHRDSYGNTIGTSTTSTDYFGNTQQLTETVMATQQVRRDLILIISVIPIRHTQILMVVLQALQQPLLITLAILRQHIVTSTANLGVAQPLQLTILVIATPNSAVTIPIQPFGLGNNSQSRPASSKPGLLGYIWYGIQLCHEVHDMTG